MEGLARCPNICIGFHPSQPVRDGFCPSTTGVLFEVGRPRWVPLRSKSNRSPKALPFPWFVWKGFVLVG